MAQKAVQKKNKTIQIPKDFIDDCKVFAIDFDKLQVKVDKLFDKWLKKTNPETRGPYTEKTIAKWIRIQMKEAGYGHTTIWQVLKESHPDVIQQGHKSFRRTESSGVTKLKQKPELEEEEEERETQYGKFEVQPSDYIADDMPKYSRTTLLKLAQWMDKKITRMLKEMTSMDAEITRLKEELKRK
jgi:hypothetical protein